jgi:tetratricopeptide (TPR) repeat protein
MDHLEPMSLRLIALELGADADKWTQLSGSLIIHREFGVGQLLRVIRLSPERRLFQIAIDFSGSGIKAVSLLGLKTNSDYISIRVKREHATLPFLANALRLLEQRLRLDRADEEKQRKRNEQTQRAQEQRRRERNEQARRARERTALSIVQWEQQRNEQALHAQERMAPRIAQWEEVSGRSWADAATAFRQLASDWNVPVQEFFPDDPVFNILEKLENYQPLSRIELEMLAERGAPELASSLDRIRVKEVEYAETGAVGILAAISKLWRGLNRPEMALQVTGRVIGNDHKPVQLMTLHSEASLLTTRGGAFRDVGDLKNARCCAQRSIDIRPNHGFAYCLLGAIDHDEGDIAQGEANFSECERLPPPSDVDAWRRGALQSTKFPAEYAAYLLDKNRDRFAWAKKYLRGPTGIGNYETPF